MIGGGSTDEGQQPVFVTAHPDIDAGCSPGAFGDVGNGELARNTKADRPNGEIDLAGLHPTRGADDVLNGIAWDADAQRLFVTGKLWSTLYEITVTDTSIPAADDSSKQ